MIIQIWHSQSSEYKMELYDPIKGSDLFQEHSWIFPHDGVEVNSRETLQTVTIFIAEVSYPSTGLGIELWFASVYGKKILCIYKIWSKLSSSHKYITSDFIEYDTSWDMVEKLTTFLKSL